MKPKATRSGRPCWAVIVKGTRAKLASAIARHMPALDEDEDNWVLVEGTAGHLAIVEYAPGSEMSGEQELAIALSKVAKARAYVLWFYEDSTRVTAFSTGKELGEVSAWPDTLAVQLGLAIPGTDRQAHVAVDLTPVKPRKAKTPKPGEQKILKWTITDWTEMMRHLEWSVMLDDADDTTVGELVAAMQPSCDARTRAMACKLAGAVPVYRMMKRGPECAAELAKLAAKDPAPTVRAAAHEAHRDFVESFEAEVERSKERAKPRAKKR